MHSKMIRTVTPEEAAVLSRGCAPLLGMPDRALIMLNADLREVCRVHVWRQDWLTPDGRSTSHVEIRVPAMGVVFIDDRKTHFEFSHKGLFVNRDVVGVNAWEDARREIHAWMECQLGHTCPLEASQHTNGGWFEEAEFVMRDRAVPNLRFTFPDDLGPRVRRAWASFVSEPAGAQDVDERGLADLADEAFDVVVAVPFEQTEADKAGVDPAPVDDVGFGVDDDEEPAVQLRRAGDHLARADAVGDAEGVGGRIALGPQLDLALDLGTVIQPDLFDSRGQGDVERGAKARPNPVRPAHRKAVLAELHRRGAPPGVALCHDRGCV